MDIAQFISNQDLKYLTRRSGSKAAAMLAANWLVIALAFTLAALWPNPISILFILILLGGRQLGLSILMHECSHGTFFQSKWANEVIGKWLIAYPVLLDLDAYRRVHLRHHRWAGTEQDPDLPNYRAYPVSRQSFRRKIFRDLTGQTAFRLTRAFGAEGALVEKSSGRGEVLMKSAVAQLLLLVPLVLAGWTWTYLLWPLAYLTTYMLFLRIRQVAEHAAVPDLFHPDPREHTRTTYAHVLARLTVAPNFVNFHCDHHVLPQVPAYHLKAFHRRLFAAGFYQGSPPFPSYGAVLRHVTNLGP